MWVYACGQKIAVDPNKTKEELALHLAKAVLTGSFAGRENMFKALSTLASVSIPSYLAALKYLESAVANVPPLVRFAPIALWVSSLGICFGMLFPRREYFDLKDVEGIVRVHSNSVRRARKWAMWALGAITAGLSIAGWIIALA